jgi:hypothetical protein
MRGLVEGGEEDFESEGGEEARDIVFSTTSDRVQMSKWTPDSIQRASFECS